MAVQLQPGPTMELPTPYHIGGHYYVDSLSVGRLPDEETVRDCAGCRGYVYDDRWHVVARVRDTAAGTRQTHHYCSDDCLTAWLRLVTAEPPESYRPGR